MKINRNALCPCGSGKKYKICCLNKCDGNKFSEQDEVIPTLKKMQSESRIKQCLHPDKAQCSDCIVGAHSIQNNGILREISTNGLVYMPLHKIETFFDIDLTSYGRKQASIFTGFCKFHDSITFKDIEEKPFIYNEKQIFLFVYRCFALEYHKKLEAIKLNQTMLKKKPSLVNNNEYIETGNMFELSVQDLNKVKIIFDESLLKNDYHNKLNSLIWEFDQDSKFAATGFVALEKDLNGNRLQQIGDTSITMKHIFFISFPQNGKTFSIIAWLTENNELFKSFELQLMALTKEQSINFLSNLIILNTENLAINPEAWDSLSEIQKHDFYFTYNGWRFGIEDQIYESILERTEFNLFDL